MLELHRLDVLFCLKMVFLVGRFLVSKADSNNVESTHCFYTTRKRDVQLGDRKRGCELTVALREGKWRLVVRFDTPLLKSASPALLAASYRRGQHCLLREASLADIHSATS